MAASPVREWIDQTDEAFARRCLPLLIANQHGWHLLCRQPVRAVWLGGNGPDAVQVESEGGDVISHFGGGVITWTVPFLFRTPPGWNLWVRGPANYPKDAIVPLEGIVETDWSSATFTMNWMFTRRDAPVVFEAGEPFCLMVPVERGSLERFSPRINRIETDAATSASYRKWRNSRAEFNQALQAEPATSARDRWQRHYFRGTDVTGVRAVAHETRLHVPEFEDIDPLPKSAEHERNRPMADEFEEKDLPLLNPVLANHPGVREPASLVKQISARAKFPIEGLDDLAASLGGPDATFNLGGRTISLAEAREFIPAYYFPISSERDLITKLSDIQSRPSSITRVPEAPHPTERIDVKWEAQRVELPPDALDAPKLSAQQVFEAVHADLGASGLARRPD